MRHLHRVLLAATVALSACGSDGSTAPTTTPAIETRLAAAAVAPSQAIADPQVTVNVTVTNSLAETVSGSVCANVVLARTPSNSTWTNVTATTAACPTLAVIVAPGASAAIRGLADGAKLRAVLGGNTGTLVLRVQHTLSGGSTNYTLQSNDVTWSVN